MESTRIGTGQGIAQIDQPDFRGILTIYLYLLNVWFPDNILKHITTNSTLSKYRQLVVFIIS